MKKQQRPSKFAMMITESFDSGIRKARAEHFAKGLPVVYMRNGKIHHEYPPKPRKRSTSKSAT